MNIQINGRRSSADTRKAERFFSERRIPYHFRDVVEKPLSEGELTSICRSVDAEQLLDSAGARFKQRGLEFLLYDPLDVVRDDPLLLRTPIVRNGKQATVGYAPEAWESWLKA